MEYKNANVCLQCVCPLQGDLLSVTFDRETTEIRLLILTQHSAAITLQTSKVVTSLVTCKVDLQCMHCFLGHVTVISSRSAVYSVMDCVCINFLQTLYSMGPKNGLHAFGYNYVESEPIWMKFGTV